MRLLWCLLIEEKDSSLCGYRLANRQLAVIFTLFQLSVALASFFQHIFSIYHHNHIFLCKSNITYETADFETKFLSYDIMIFDFGLMRRVLGTTECVANYLDGGYMRFAWCFQHVSALSLALMALLCCPRPIWLLWPALMMQSSYSLGMSILTMATAPKILEALSGIVDVQLATSFTFYIGGFCLNWLFTFVLWHHYWHVEHREERRNKVDRECRRELVGSDGEEIDDDNPHPEFV
ncbi:unnamed protein product, partial [Mesorhabditis belari]|uniref:Uncharacterized protein n=1 Tax=Mesorhabditis belari TaxID=2138241 RepID=A0AAF3FNE7_9BILA